MIKGEGRERVITRGIVREVNIRWIERKHWREFEREREREGLCWRERGMGEEYRESDGWKDSEGGIEKVERGYERGGVREGHTHMHILCGRERERDDR